MTTTQPESVTITCVGKEVHSALDKIIKDLAAAYHLKEQPYSILNPNPATLPQLVFDPQKQPRYYSQMNAILRQVAATEGALLTGVDMASNQAIAENIAAKRAVKSCAGR